MTETVKMDYCPNPINLEERGVISEYQQILNLAKENNSNIDFEYVKVGKDGETPLVMGENVFNIRKVIIMRIREVLKQKIPNLEFDDDLLATIGIVPAISRRDEKEVLREITFKLLMEK